MKACAKHGVAVEINGNPWRLELDWRWHRKALELGCMLSINPDAHSIAELDLVQWGVAVARKGGVPKEKVLNALSLKQMLAHLARRRSRQMTRPVRKLARSKLARKGTCGCARGCPGGPGSGASAKESVVGFLQNVIRNVGRNRSRGKAGPRPVAHRWRAHSASALPGSRQQDR